MFSQLRKLRPSKVIARVNDGTKNISQRDRSQDNKQEPIVPKQEEQDARPRIHDASQSRQQKILMSLLSSRYSQNSIRASDSEIFKYARNSLGNLHIAKMSTSITEYGGVNSSVNRRSPSEDKLQRVYDELLVTLPQLFDKTLNMDIYHQDIVFENRIHDTRTEGLLYYTTQLRAIRLLTKFKFSNVKLTIAGSHKSEKDNCIVIHWQIRARSKLSQLQKPNKNDIDYRLDGYSIFYVDNSGKIWKHIADNTVRSSAVALNESLLTKFSAMIGVLLLEDELCPQPIPIGQFTM